MVPKLELDSNSDSANQQYYFKHFGKQIPQTSQGAYQHAEDKPPFMESLNQPQSATNQHTNTGQKLFTSQRQFRPQVAYPGIIGTDTASTG